MAQRSYVLAKLESPADRPALEELLARLEELDEVAFAEPVVGAYDLLITLDTAKSLEAVLKNLATFKPLCDLVGLKANPLPGRARLQRNLNQIPVTRP